jgi:nitroreductase
MNRRNVLVAGGALAGAGLGAALIDVARGNSMREYDEAVTELRARLAEQPQERDFVRLATLAANGHNTQPWRFELRAGRIEILPDFSRRTPVVDPDDHHLFVGLGCAAENLGLAAAAGGSPGEVRFDAAGDGSIVFEFHHGARTSSLLADAIVHRQSSRTEYDGRAVAMSDLATLAATVRDPTVDLILLTERRQLEQVAELVVAGNTAQMESQAFVNELKQWIRFDTRQALATRDGLFAGASGSPVIPPWLGGPLFDLAFRTAGENDKYVRQMRSSAGVAVFIGKRNTKDHWTSAGRACQRFLLQATVLGLKCAFVNQAVEIPTVRQQLASYLGFSDRRPNLVVRFGSGPEMTKSLRRPVEQVMVATAD